MGKTLITSGNFIDRNRSLTIKGFAIIMMVAHHCFAFPDFWLDEVSIPAPVVNVFLNFKLCVALFAFLTGYSFFVGKRKSFTGYLKKALAFLGQYWFQLFAVFIPIALLEYSFSLKKIIYNLFAVYDNIIIFAWYVLFYLIVVLTFPYFVKLLRFNTVVDTVITVVVCYAVTVVLYFLSGNGNHILSALVDCSVYYPVVGIGYITAKHNLFGKIYEKLKYPLPIALVMIIAAFLVRMKFSAVKGFSFDVIYAPIIVFSLCCILNKCHKVTNGILAYLGKISFPMWLFHSVFFSGYTRRIAQPVVAFNDNLIIRFAAVFLLSAIFAALYTFVYDKIRKITNKYSERSKSQKYSV